MKKFIFSRSAAIVLIAASIVSYAVGATVNVDVNTKHQTIRGFGGCSAWCGTLSANVGELLFDTTKGAGLSMLRIQIQRDGVDDVEKENAKLATSYGVTVWGTPWFCKNGVSTGRGYDTLYEKDYQEWANTLAATANDMKNLGTPLFAISSGNEIDLGWTKYDQPALANFVGNY